MASNKMSLDLHTIHKLVKYKKKAIIWYNKPTESLLRERIT